MLSVHGGCATITTMNTDNQINESAAAILRILLDDGIPAAERYVSEHFVAAVEAAKSELDRAQMELMHAQNVLAFARIGRKMPLTAQVQGSARLHTFMEAEVVEPLADKRAMILATAAELGASLDIVTTDDVIAALAQKGFTLPGARPGTSIGNMLNKSTDWVRVAEGKFKPARTIPQARGEEPPQNRLAGLEEDSN